MEEPDEGNESSSDAFYWKNAMEDMANKCTARERHSARIEAFDRTVEQFSGTFPELWHFSNDGTEEQILVDMLFKKIIEPNIKRDLLAQAMSLPTLRRKLIMWYQTLTAINVLLRKAHQIIWPAVIENIKNLACTLEPIISQNMEHIVKVKNQILTKVTNATSSQLSEYIDTLIIPFMEPTLKALLAPVNKGLQLVEKLFNDIVDKLIVKAPTKGITYHEVVYEFDRLSRTWELWHEIDNVSTELMEIATTLSQVSSETFQHVDPWWIRHDAINFLLETVDAAGYSFQLLVKTHFKIDAANLWKSFSDSQTITLEAIKGEVNERLRHDIQLGKNVFIKKAIQRLTMKAFNIKADPLAKTVLAPIDFANCISEDAKDIISARAEFDELKDSFVKESIGKFIDGFITLPEPITSALIPSQEHQQWQ